MATKNPTTKPKRPASPLKGLPRHKRREAKAAVVFDEPNMNARDKRYALRQLAYSVKSPLDEAGMAMYELERDLDQRPARADQASLNALMNIAETTLRILIAQMAGELDSRTLMKWIDLTADLHARRNLDGIGRVNLRDWC